MNDNVRDDSARENLRGSGHRSAWITWVGAVRREIERRLLPFRVLQTHHVILVDHSASEIAQYRRIEIGVKPQSGKLGERSGRAVAGPSGPDVAAADVLNFRYPVGVARIRSRRAHEIAPAR